MNTEHYLKLILKELDFSLSRTGKLKLFLCNVIVPNFTQLRNEVYRLDKLIHDDSNGRITDDERAYLERAASAMPLISKRWKNAKAKAEKYREDNPPAGRKFPVFARLANGKKELVLLSHSQVLHLAKSADLIAV